MVRAIFVLCLLLSIPIAAFSQSISMVDNEKADSLALTPAPVNTSSTLGSRAVDVVGGTNYSSTKSGLAKGNCYRVDTSVLLTQAEFWLDFKSNQTLNYYVYEGPAEMGTYTQIYFSTQSVSGTGAGWYSTGPITVPLVSGMYYVIAVSFSGSTTYFYNTGDDEPTSFGAHVHGYAIGKHPLGPTIDTNSNDMAIYHQQLTTDKMPGGLTVDVTQISETKGGVANFQLSAGAANANRGYMIFGSVTGSSPGTPFPGGYIVVPFNWDLATNIIINFANTTLFPNFYGYLDAGGNATAAFDTLGPIPGTAGITFTFAFACNNPWDYASNSVDIDIVP